MGKRTDTRPKCTCEAYPFPHKVGGRCRGYAFITAYWQFCREHCAVCNNFRDGVCETVIGKASLEESECYIEAKDIYAGGYLPLTVVDYFGEEYEDAN